MINLLPSRNGRLAVFTALLLGESLTGLTGTLPVAAQINPDSSLEAPSQLVRNVIVNSAAGDRIEGGAQRGANLFHSFSQFSVSEGQRVYFTNPTGVERIFTRVTGSTRSEILGTVGVLGNADLFLINPNGIEFGRNARLEVQGSFLATTANAVQFGDQGVFNASAPETPALLTINPSALWFNQLQPAPIVTRSTAPVGTSPGGFGLFGLRVPNGRTLRLVGGAVQLDQGSVVALGGRVELGGLAAPGAVEFTENKLSFPTGVERADVSLTNGASVDVAAGGGGDVGVTARNLTIAQQSGIYAGIVAPGGTARQAGTIALDATESIQLDGQGSTLENSVSANVAGNSGDIQVSARTFSVTNGASVLTLSGSQGNAGHIRIAATEAIAVSGFGNRFSSAITSQVRPGRAGTGGNVTLTTRNLAVTNSASVGTATFGRGNAGNVTLIADTIAVDGVGSSRSSVISSSVAPQAVGNGGVIDIQTGSLTVTNGGRLFASTFGQGNAGDIRVNARDHVGLDGVGSNQFPSAIVSQVATPGIGNGGNLQISAPTVTLTKGAQLAASTFGRGRAGDITIQAQDAVVFDGVGSNDDPSGAFSSVEARAIGNGGNISITSDSFRLTNDAGLFASTSGRGDAGKIRVQAENSVVLATGGSILSSVEPTGSGDGQEIAIQTRSLSLASNAQINASTAGDGKAGQIQVAADTLEIDTGGRLLTTTTSRRDAGNLRLQVRDRIALTGADSGLFANTAVGSGGNGGTIFVAPSRLVLQDGARIAVDSQGSGTGGNIEIQADTLTLDRAAISAETVSNTGGNITLNVPNLLLLRRGSLISTTAGTIQGNGNGGNIDLAAGFVVAVPAENSDIAANAFRGNGGNINITTQGIFGIGRSFGGTAAPRPTPLSDITASSQFGLNGVVTINTLSIDPIQGTVELPATFSAPAIAQGCQASSRTSRFVNQGRGGVSPSPVDPLTSDTIWQDWDAIDPGHAYGSAKSAEFSPQTTAAPQPLIEAQGWSVAPNGEIRLVAHAPMVTPDGDRQREQSSCR